jgi:hypothetical protein
MPGALKLFAQLDKIIDLTVKNNLQTSVFVANRLGAALYVNDAEPAMPQCDLAIPKVPVSVRSSMFENRGHPFKGDFVNGIARPIKDTA